MAYACPKCGGFVQRGYSGRTQMAAGLVGAAFYAAFGAFTCKKCGKIARSEFPPEVRAKMAAGTFALIFCGLALAAVGKMGGKPISLHCTLFSLDGEITKWVASPFSHFPLRFSTKQARLTPGPGRNNAEAGKPRARLHADRFAPSAFIRVCPHPKKYVTVFIESCTKARKA
jgi:hypothetical protein